MDDYDVKVPNFTILEGSEYKTAPFFSFPELRYSLLEFNSRKFSSIWRIKRDRISALKFKAARVHFLSEVFVAVAVVDALAPSFPSSNETLHIMYCYVHDIGTQWQ